MKERDFYRARDGRYVATEPLYVSSRVLKAAERADVEVVWDEKGRIHKIPFYDAKKLLAELGSVLLTTREYFDLLAEVRGAGDETMRERLETKEFAEWLDTAYKVVGGVTYRIDRPRAEDTDGSSLERFDVVDIPTGRPGWFRLDVSKINHEGLPQNVCEDKTLAERQASEEACGAMWKYWSPQRTDIPVGVLRGYVLSSDTNSLDNDIPLFARHPKTMIREVRARLDDLQEANEPTRALLALIDAYRKTLVLKPMDRMDREVEAFFGDFGPKAEVIERYRQFGVVEDDIERRALEETLADIEGKAKAFDRARGIEDRGASVVLTRDALVHYLKQCPEDIRAALANKDKIVFVRGHDHPDADVVFSAVFEAFRRSRVYDEVCVPVVSGVLSDDVVDVLGDDVCQKILHTTSELYERAEKSGLVRWTYVDTQETTNDQFLDSVIDHRLSPKEFPYFVAVSREMGWSATLQVYGKLLGCGLDLDQELSHMFLAGTLLEAEYSLLEKVMGCTDRLFYNDLLRRSGCDDPKALYTKVIQPLIAKTDAETLFYRDYKQSHAMLGFAVVKQSGMYDEEGTCLDEAMRKQLMVLAHENNATLNIPLTMVKITDYCDDGVSVNCEEILPVFNTHWKDLGFREAVNTVLLGACTKYHQGRADVLCTEEGIKIPLAKVQFPRLLMAPLLAPLAEEQAKFFYSDALGKYVARGFYDGSAEPYGVAEDGASSPVAMNYLSYEDMKRLLDGGSNVSVMTLADYWGVYREATTLNDINMLATLRDPNFVEMLDTFILNATYVFDRPRLTEDGVPDAASSCAHVRFERAHPGLIYPLEVDALGVPTRIHQPDIYEDPKLWRYWGPDKEKLIACRGHIFLLDQTALDLKIPSHEKHQNMGFRPVYECVPPIVCRVEEKDDWVAVKVRPRSFGIYDAPVRLDEKPSKVPAALEI